MENTLKPVPVPLSSMATDTMMQDAELLNLHLGDPNPSDNPNQLELLTHDVWQLYRADEELSEDILDLRTHVDILYAIEQEKLLWQMKPRQSLAISSSYRPMKLQPMLPREKPQRMRRLASPP